MKWERYGSETSAMVPTGPSIQLLHIGRNISRAVEIAPRK